MLNNLGQKISKEFVLCLGLGLLAAVIGSFAVISFVMPAEYWGGGTSIASQNKEFLKTSLGIKAYGRLEVFQFLDKALPSVAAIYRKKPSSPQFADNLYLTKDRMGYGFILTSDGWIVSGKSVVGAIGAKGLSIAIKEKIYQAESVIFDDWTDTAFIKINAKDLAVTPLGDSAALGLGDIVFSGKDKHNFWFSYVAAINFYPDQFSKSDLILSSEEFGKIIKLQDSVPLELNGGMAANKNGEVVGVIVASPPGGYIVPVNYFKDIVSGVLRNRAVLRPYLGVNYIDLSNAAARELPRKEGAYLYGGSISRAVAINSPAYKAGLKAGDIILGIDGENVNEFKNLAEMIADYKAGENITIKILRDGKELNLNIVLGAM